MRALERRRARALLDLEQGRIREALERYTGLRDRMVAEQLKVRGRVQEDSAARYVGAAYDIYTCVYVSICLWLVCFIYLFIPCSPTVLNIRMYVCIYINRKKEKDKRHEARSQARREQERLNGLRESNIASREREWSLRIAARIRFVHRNHLIYHRCCCCCCYYSSL